jgi:hypothetical protein
MYDDTFVYPITVYTPIHMVQRLPQPLRFFALCFIVLLGVPCGGDVAVVTADRPSPVPARAGKLGCVCAGCQGSCTVQHGMRRTRIANRRSEGHSLTVLGSAVLPAIVQDPSFSEMRQYRPR